MKCRNILRLIISLIIFIILLFIKTNPILAGSEVVLNSALSVTVPDTQSGNPGDFLTYVLAFENRSANPVNLDVEYLIQNQWNVLGDTNITVPAQTSNFYLPVTIMIPPNALANTEATIQVRLKVSGQAFALPIVAIPVRVNPVAALNFSTPPSQKGTYGGTVTYKIVLVNNGNTIEQLQVKASSQNFWPVKVEPQNFSINPEQSITVQVDHQIPASTTAASDEITLVLSWHSQQKLITLTTRITDKWEALGDRYYIWQGQFGLSHYDLSDLNDYNPGITFSLQGQWLPSAWSQLYLENIFDETDRNWFTDLRFKDWGLKTGVFSLSWPGLVTPSVDSGKMFLNKTLADRNNLSIYAWDSTASGATPLALEYIFTDHSTWRLLHDPEPGYDQSVLEWEYNKQGPKLNWSTDLAYDLANQDSYAYQLYIGDNTDKWYWNANYKYFKYLMDYDFDKEFTAVIGQPGNIKRFYSHYQFSWESNQTTQLNEDFRLEAQFNWPSKYQLWLTQEYHYIDSDYSSDNLSLFLTSPYWQTAPFKNHWWINISSDNSDATETTYLKFAWSTEYELNSRESWLFRAELAGNIAGASDNHSNLGSGLKYHWVQGADLTALIYYYLDTDPNWKFDLSLDWRIYQYLLTFKYLGWLGSGTSNTDYLSLTLNRRFSIPVKKPLGIFEGTVFVDRNRDNLYDSGETLLRNLEFLLDGKIAFRSDERGHYQLSGIEPGTHQITIDPRYEINYFLPDHQIIVSIKPYETQRVNLPLIRSQNISGLIYLDKNLNHRKDEGEIPLGGISIVLNDIQNKESQHTYSDNDGSFTFYQLQLQTYTITIDPAKLSEEIALPQGFVAPVIDAGNLEELPSLEIDLVPFEKPMEIVTPETSVLSLELDQEIITLGQTLKISIESSQPLKLLRLTLPTGEDVPFNIDKAQTRWSYLWKIPANSLTGQAKIICRGETLDGQPSVEEINLIILPK